MSLLANGGLPWKRVRWRYFGGDILVEGWRRKWKNGEVWRIWWKEKEGRKKKKEKEKKLKREDILLEEKSGNNYSGGFPGFGCGCGNLSGKYRNRPEIKYLGTTRNNYQKSRIIF